jgi:hypothetical protein
VIAISMLEHKVARLQDCIDRIEAELDAAIRRGDNIGEQWGEALTDGNRLRRDNVRLRRELGLAGAARDALASAILNGTCCRYAKAALASPEAE